MLLQLLELASNRALEFDPDTRERLKKLEGRSLCLHITTLSQSVSLTPQASGLELSSQIPDQVDVTLKASIPALIKLGRDGLDEVELEPGELEIIGDPLVGQRFAQILIGRQCWPNNLGLLPQKRFLWQRTLLFL